MPSEISSPLRPHIREAFRPAPTRWITEDLLFALFKGLTEIRAAETRRGYAVNVTEFREALNWNVERGYIEKRVNTETETAEWRLTATGRESIGA